MAQLDAYSETGHRAGHSSANICSRKLTRHKKLQVLSFGRLMILSVAEACRVSGKGGVLCCREGRRWVSVKGLRVLPRCLWQAVRYVLDGWLAGAVRDYFAWVESRASSTVGARQEDAEDAHMGHGV